MMTRLTRQFGMVLHSDTTDTPPLQPLLRRALFLALVLGGGIFVVAILPQQLIINPATHASLHTLLEISAVVVAALIFTTGWITTGSPQPRSTVFLASAFLVIGLIDLLHLLSYQGMPDLITPSNPEKAINFWLAARLLSAVTLLLFILFPSSQPATNRVRFLSLGVALALAALVAWIGLRYPDRLPDMFITGNGLTALKNGLEYLIAALFLAGACLLLIRRHVQGTIRVESLLFALITLSASGVCFTLYRQVTDGFNLLGHLYKLLADLFLYHAVFVSVVLVPYRRLRNAYEELAHEKHALQASEARFSALNTSIEELIFTLDREGRHTDVFGRWVEKSGLTPAHFLGRSARELLGPEAAAVHEAANARALAGEPVLYDWTVEAPDGMHYYQTSLAPLRDQDGNITGLIGLGRDLTAQYSAERALHERDDLLRLAYDAAQLGTWRHDIADDTVTLDTRAQAHLGLDKPMVLLEEFVARVYPEDRELVQQTIIQTLAPTSDGRHEFEYRIEHPAHGIRWIAVHVRIYFAGEGSKRRPIFTAGTTQDVTERHQAEAELRAGEARFRMLADQAQDLIYRYRLGPNPGFEYVSPSATAITGYTPEDHYADPFLGFKLVHPDDRALLQNIENLPPNSNEPITLRWIRQDGSMIWTEQSNRLIRDENGQPAAIEGIARDITERKRAEQELRDAAEALQHLSRRLVEAHERERRHIARELHDEVGQVLTGLKLTLTVAADRAPVDLAQTLNEAQVAINELMGRVRGLSLDLRPALLDDMGLLPALGWYLDRYTPRTGVRVTLRHQGVNRRFPPEIETVAYRVIQEALTNVARHAGVAWADVRILADAERLMLRIDDQGRGFDADTDLSIRTTGGLSGMHERVHLIGGVLTIESAPDTGAHVIAELPLPTREE